MKHWNGTLEYFASDKIWTTWDGTATLSSVENDGEYVLYLRGTGNSVITGNNSNYRWVLTGSNIACIGNIENLLDYETVKFGNHPTMTSYCYKFMFSRCSSLTQAPELPATTMVPDCYNFMFSYCTNLIQAPALPATTLASNCYYAMFLNCSSLTQAPVLPATTLDSSCYGNMFQGCTSLTQAPELPATTLSSNCYKGMFYKCTSLTKAPTLPATTMESFCYWGMFQGCTSLIQIPTLSITKLNFGCCDAMFSDCTNIKLSSTQTGEYTQEYRLSSADNATGIDAFTDMFTSTGGTFTGTPSSNTNYYLSSNNIIVRETEIATLNSYMRSMIDVVIGDAIGGSY